VDSMLKVIFDAAVGAASVVLADQIKQRGPQIIDYVVKHAPEILAKLKNKFHHAAKPQQPQPPQQPPLQLPPQQLQLKPQQ